ncbi:hypothetical protein BRC97_05275 [Halobacteriales archaeon QS_6_71_20]|nr:MAG: hypothetical protein BRC97_05275 [Halobacteriales archaeon QS_6_71_20]
MPLKGAGVGDGLSVLNRWDRGFSWAAHPEEGFERAAHAIVAGAAGGEGAGGNESGSDGDDGSVWVVDPVDSDGLDGELAELGSVAGVVVLCDNHRRHAGRIADRHGVRVFVHDHLGNLRVDAPTAAFTDGLADTGFRAVPVVSRLWREIALYHPGRGTLVVGDALTTMDSHTNPGERLAVMPHLRVTPPSDALGGITPKRILVGHGDGVHRGAADALTRALDGARRGAPRAVLGNLPLLVRNAYVTLRD